ncbi:hypothetical protein F4780DRAFT_780809 [Xylariomycetidae sp. FL0641]|nr:hypothetical protein F4780DRAFT_780809 [Xylariomycetidae sp. FL0641]
MSQQRTPTPSSTPLTAPQQYATLLASSLTLVSLEARLAAARAVIPRYAELEARRFALWTQVEGLLGAWEDAAPIPTPTATTTDEEKAQGAYLDQLAGAADRLRGLVACWDEKVDSMLVEEEEEDLLEEEGDGDAEVRREEEGYGTAARCDDVRLVREEAVELLLAVTDVQALAGAWDCERVGGKRKSFSS